MHPDDVAEYVAGQVAWLAERIDERPSLGVTEVSLEENVQVYIALTKRERARASAMAPAHMVGPGQQPIGLKFTGVDLGAAVTLRRLLLHCDCSDFDGSPPTAELRLPDRTPLPAAEWPQELGGQGIVADHPIFRRPFFCRPGLREFHTHPQHEDHPWDRYRESMSLSRIIVPLLDDLQHRWLLGR